MLNKKRCHLYVLIIISYLKLQEKLAILDKTIVLITCTSVWHSRGRIMWTRILVPTSKFELGVFGWAMASRKVVVRVLVCGKDKSHLVEQLFFLEKLLAPYPTCQPPIRLTSLGHDHNEAARGGALTRGELPGAGSWPWLDLKMATGTYPMGTGHPYPHPPDQNLTRRVTRTRSRVENSFHTRTRWVILTRRVILTRQYTRVHTPKYNSFQQNKSTIEQQNRNMGWWRSEDED